MLTGPVTILQWSFVRNDQPRNETCKQIALAIRKEVKIWSESRNSCDSDWWACYSWRASLTQRIGKPISIGRWTASVYRQQLLGMNTKSTHMCYSEFNDIIAYIAKMDKIITIECSRSQMELLDTFAEFKYPNEIGQGFMIFILPVFRAETKWSIWFEKLQSYSCSSTMGESRLRT